MPLWWNADMRGLDPRARKSVQVQVLSGVQLNEWVGVLMLSPSALVNRSSSKTDNVSFNKYMDVRLAVFLFS